MKITNQGDYEYQRGRGRPTIYGTLLAKIAELEPGQAGLVEPADLPESARGVDAPTLRKRLAMALRTHTEREDAFYRARTTDAGRVVIECHPLLDEAEDE